MDVLSALASARLPRRARWATWQAREPALAGLRSDELHAALLDRSGHVNYDHRDDLLAALIRLSRDDEQATVVLIGCLMPGLRGVVRRHGTGIPHEEATAVALSALYLRIRRYPLNRRPRHIAMNLLMDTAHDLIAARGRELAWRARTCLSDRPAERPGPTPADWSPSLLWSTAHQAGILTTREIALIHTTRVRDQRLADVAPLLGLTHDAARKARLRAELKLRAWWDRDHQAA